MGFPPAGSLGLASPTSLHFRQRLTRGAQSLTHVFVPDSLSLFLSLSLTYASSDGFTILLFLLNTLALHLLQCIESLLCLPALAPDRCSRELAPTSVFYGANITQACARRLSGTGCADPSYLNVLMSSLLPSSSGLFTFLELLLSFFSTDFIPLHPSFAALPRVSAVVVHWLQPVSRA
ncbi:hypothetical protein PC120_g25310 [Phytophthora cactorum]|nr:hypothetical protein PC120_g25310 [Phytophthora cactorum]